MYADDFDNTFWRRCRCSHRGICKLWRAGQDSSDWRKKTEKDFPIVLSGRVGLECHTDRRALGGPVGDIESPVVLGALDERPLDESVGEMGMTMSADAVGGIEGSLGRAIDGVGVPLMIEADDILLLQEPADAYFDPTVHCAPLGGKDLRWGRRVGPDCRRGELAGDVIRRIFHLSQHGGNEWKQGRGSEVPEAAGRLAQVLLPRSRLTTARSNFRTLRDLLCASGKL
jgi:hypothetical protein